MADTKSTTDKLRDGFNEHVAEPAKKIAESGSTIGMKMIDQAEANAREAFAAMRAAASAKDVSDVMKIQGDYLRDQGSRAMGQAREIGELIVQFGKDAIAPLKRD